MIRKHHDCAPTAATHTRLGETESALLLQLIQERAYRIHLQLAVAGRYESPQDDWIKAEAEIMHELGCTTCWRPQDHSD